MTSKKFLPLIFVLIFNLWLIRIFKYNAFIGLVVVFGTIVIYLSIWNDLRKYLILSAISIFILMIFQYQTGPIKSLLNLSENERIEQLQRMKGYPKSLYRFANWLEQRKEIVIFYGIGKNFSEVIDPNFYFLANHPRERIGVTEYEKIPYILLPFFIIGILSIKRSGLNILFLSVSPVILLSMIGNGSPIGPFSLFPFFMAYIAKGLEPIFKNKKYIFAFLIIFGLVFIQIVSYATH